MQDEDEAPDLAFPPLPPVLLTGTDVHALCCQLSTMEKRFLGPGTIKDTHRDGFTWSQEPAVKAAVLTHVREEVGLEAVRPPAFHARPHAEGRLLVCSSEAAFKLPKCLPRACHLP